MQKMPYVFPIVGGRKVEHLNANLEALDIALTPEHIKKIEGAVPFELGFPNGFIVSVATIFYTMSLRWTLTALPLPLQRGTAQNTTSVTIWRVTLISGPLLRRSARRRCKLWDSQ